MSFETYKSKGGLLILLAVIRSQTLAQYPVEKPNVLIAISDDQSWCDASAYGNQEIKTPAFDRIAKQGVLFHHAYCSAPSCTPSRGALLTGQEFWRLEEGSQLFGALPSKFVTYTELLEQHGYTVGFMGKGWGPGDYYAGGRTCNPAGTEEFKSFLDFIESIPEGSPWCFWFGSNDAHRPYQKGLGVESGIDPDKINVPDFMPDVREVRSDLADYYFEIQRFDSDLNKILKILDEKGHFNNTLVIVTSDNGMSFPHAKATLYDYGTRMPLAICWGNNIKGSRNIFDFVSLIDLAPTILNITGIDIPTEMTGISMVSILFNEGKVIPPLREFICVGRERHSWVRDSGMGYPCRMIRTKQYLYIRNYHPSRWPMGDPTYITNCGTLGDVDASPTKDYMLTHMYIPETIISFQLAFGKRPPEELYDCVKDSFQMLNLAYDNEYQLIKNQLSKKLTEYLVRTNDPRETGQPVKFDDYEYYGRNDWKTNPYNYIIQDL